MDLPGSAPWAVDGRRSAHHDDPSQALTGTLPVVGFAALPNSFPIAALGPPQSVEFEEEQRQDDGFSNRPFPLPEIGPSHAADRSPADIESRSAVSTGRFVARTSQLA